MEIILPATRWWTKTLNGAERAKVADSIWSQWRDRHRRVVLLTGFTGVGKTELADALLTETVHEGALSLRITLPSGGVADLDGFVRDQLAEEAKDAGLGDLAHKQLLAAPNLRSALKIALGAQNLVVIDEFQEVFNEADEPPRQVLQAVEKLTKEVGPGGLLLLVSSRAVAGAWPERCHHALLEAPSGDDAVAVLRGAVLSPDHQPSREDAGAAVRRLGGNPRALGLLGAQLDRYTMEELLGNEPDIAPAGPLDERLVRDLEDRLVGKALLGLDNGTLELLDKLAVLRLPARNSLASTLAGGSKHWGTNSRPLRDRYLVRLRGKAYQVHPAAREILVRQLYKRPTEFKSSHVLAAQWYADPIRKLGKVQRSNLSGVGHRLDEARFHYGTAGAREDLLNLLSGLLGYIEKRFQATTPYPRSRGDLDARIELLDAVLQQPGKAGTHEHLARLFATRRAEGDLVRAVLHAERSTSGQTHGIPWVLWAKLEAELNGKAAGAEVAQRGVVAVVPGKDLHCVYQVLGACLNHLGKDAAAVDALWDGYQRDTNKKRHRLVEEAIWFAAASSELVLLDDLIRKCEADGNLGSTVTLARLHRLMRQGDWRGAAEGARVSFAANRRYVQTAMLSALAWLGTSDAQEAQAELDRLPQGLHLGLCEGGTWLAALVAVQRADLPRARECYQVYMGEDAPEDLAGLRAALLREWDERVGVIGEAMPSLNFPVLPASVTGLDRDVVRPQHGAPVLPARLKSRVNPAVEVTDDSEEPKLNPMPKQSRALRILHISDLHERAAFAGMPANRQATLDWDAEQRGLVLGPEFMEALSELDKVDLVLFTGDLADWGRPEEYQLATSRMDKILSAVGVDRSRFFAVPGNHDVQREIEKEAWTQLHDWLDDTHNGARLGQWFRDVGRTPKGLADDVRERILSRTEAFWAWMRDFDRGELQPQASKRLGYRHSFSPGALGGLDTGVHIIGLDSAWLCGGDTDQGRIRVTEQQVLAHVRSGEGGLTGIRIALLHHPLDHLADHHEVRKLLGQHVDLLLHGHQHAPASIVMTEPGSELRVLAAGCLIEGELGKNWPNGFQFIELHGPSAERGQVHFRKWAAGNFWAPGSDIYKDAPTGTLGWSDEKGGPQPSLGSPGAFPHTEVSPSQPELQRIREQAILTRTRIRTTDLLSGLKNADETVVEAVARLASLKRMIVQRVSDPKLLVRIDAASLLDAHHRHHMVVASAGSGKTHLLHRLASLCEERGLIAICANLEEFDTSKQVLSHFDQLLGPGWRDKRDHVLVLDDWHKLAARDPTGPGSLLSATGRMRVIVGTRRAIATRGTQIWDLEPLDEQAVLRCAPSLGPPPPVLLPLVVILSWALQKNTASLGSLLWQYHQRIAPGVDHANHVALGYALGLWTRRPGRNFDALLHEASTRFSIPGLATWAAALGTVGEPPDWPRPVHDDYRDLLVGVAMMQVPELLDGSLHSEDVRPVALAVEAGFEAAYHSEAWRSSVDIRLAGRVHPAGDAALRSQILVGIVAHRVSERERAIVAALCTEDLFAEGVVAAATLEAPSPRTYRFFRGELSIQRLWTHRAELARLCQASKLGSTCIERIAVKGDGRWIPWLRQLWSTGVLPSGVALPAVLAISGELPSWVKVELPTIIADGIWRLRCVAERGRHVPLARWLVENYEATVETSQGAFVDARRLIVDCGVDETHERFLDRFLKMTPPIQEKGAFLIEALGGAYLARAQTVLLDSHYHDKLYKLVENVSDEVSDEAAWSWTGSPEHEVARLGWRTLVKRHQQSVLPKVIDALPETFDGLHKVAPLEALMELRDGPEALIEHLWSRVSGQMQPRTMGFIIDVLALCPLHGIANLAGRMAKGLRLPAYHFAKFLVHFLEWERTHQLKLRVVSDRGDEPLLAFLVRESAATHLGLDFVGEVVSAVARFDLGLELNYFRRPESRDEQTVTRLLQTTLPHYHQEVEAWLREVRPDDGFAEACVGVFEGALNTLPEELMVEVIDGLRTAGKVGSLRLKDGGGESWQDFFVELLKMALLESPPIEGAPYLASTMLATRTRQQLKALLDPHLEAPVSDNTLAFVRDVEERAGLRLVDENGAWIA